MPRVFLSHSSRDSRSAMAVKAWLIEREPGLAEEIFLDLDPHTGIRPGERWKQALQQATTRCEAVICLLSQHWEASHECKTEYRYAETLNKTILCARLEPVPDTGITSQWQRCDLFVGNGPSAEIAVDGGAPVVLSSQGLQRLLDGLRALGIGAEHFPWPPPSDPDRAPYRGWAPLEEADAAVFFGRDAQILRGLDELRGMRTSGVQSLFVILGLSGAGKSSFLRAGLLPRLRRDDHRFLPLPIVRPETAVLTGEHGFAHAIHRLRTDLGLPQPMPGAIKTACLASEVEQLRGWLTEARQAARARLLDVPADEPAPTLVLAVDQAEELFNADAGPQAPRFLELLAWLVRQEAGVTPGLIVAVTIRADRYEPLQIAPQLAGVHSAVFDELKPLPPAGYTEVITGPARRASAAGRRLIIEPALVERLLADTADSADALPLLALTLERLYRDFGGDGNLTAAEYEHEAIGGIAQVVQTEVDTLLGADPEQRQAQLELLHDAFIPWLATINPGNDQPMRRLARFDDLPATSHSLIDAFVEKRLLVKDTRDGQVVVEVALESLLRQWRELATWLRDEAQDLKDADTLERAATDWQTSGRDESWLLGGTRLADAETLATTPRFRGRLAHTREYLTACRHAENQKLAAEEEQRQAELRHAQEREAAAQAVAAAEQRAKLEAQQHAQVLLKRARVLRAVLALVVIVAVAAVFGFGWAFKAQRDADARFRDATAQRLYGESQQMLAGQNPGGGGDVQGMQMLLAALAIPSKHQGAKYPLLMALHQERDLLKVIDVPAIVSSAAFSPDGTRIASGGADNAVRVWDAGTGQPVGEPLRGHDGMVSSVAFSPDGTRIASGGLDTTVRVWDAATGRPVGEPLRGHDDPVFSVAFSPDGRRLASGSGDKTVRLWDAATGQPVGEPLRGHDDIVFSVAFSPDGTRLASGSRDNTIRLWDAATGQPVGEPLRGHDNWVFSVAFSPDGTRIASAGGDFTIRLWDAAGQPIGQPLRGHDNGVTRVAFSPDGRRIASGSTDKTIRLWDTATRREVGVLRGHRSAVESVAFSPDGLRLVSGADDNTVRLWDATSWQPLLGHDDATVAEFSDDGRRIESGGLDRTVRWWDAATGRPIGEPLRVDDPDVNDLVPIDEDRLLSFGTVDTVRLWDAHTRTPLGEPLRLGPSDPSRPVTYSKEVNRIAARTIPNLVQLWDTASMRLVGEPIINAGLVTRIRFSPDGRIVATGGLNGTVRLWDPATGKPIGQPMTGNGYVTNIAFSRDGRLLAASHLDDTLRLWDTQTFQPLGDPMQSESIVVAVAFSPDGRTLASGSGDGSIRLWDVGDRTQLGPPLTGHTAGVISLDFSPDGTKLLSGSADHTLRMWPAPTASPDGLCAKLTANMSHQQWNDWVSPDIDYITLCPNLPTR